MGTLLNKNVLNVSNMVIIFVIFIMEKLLVLKHHNKDLIFLYRAVFKKFHHKQKCILLKSYPFFHFQECHMISPWSQKIQRYLKVQW